MKPSWWIIPVVVVALLFYAAPLGASNGDEAGQQRTVTGKVTTVDSPNQRITVTYEDQGESTNETFDVANDASITVEGRRKALGDIATGRVAVLEISPDSNTVIGITVERFLKWWMILLMLIGAMAVSFFAGSLMARSFRMADYGWRIGLILSSLSWGLIILACGQPKFGVDLRGGVTLIYKIAEPEQVQGQQVERPTSDVLAKLLKDRIDPSGVQEVVIRPYGPEQIEIIIPDVGQVEVERIKRRVTRAGYLQFRIVANGKDHRDIIERSRDESQQGSRFVLDADNEPIGKWVNIKKEDTPIDGIYPYMEPVWDDEIRDARTGERIVVPDAQLALFGRTQDKVAFQRWLRDNGHDEVEVLMAINDGIDLEGAHLATVLSSFDEQARPCITFNPTAVGARKFSALTSLNLPDPQGGTERQLGIVLDNELYSAPVIRGAISTHGQITGNFAQEDVEFLVNILRAGKLPAALEEQPLSEDRIDSHLGLEMRERGKWAIGTSLGLVLVFMIFYYRFSGLVACFALFTNLVCVIALVILVKQPFSLTGLAGLVLTVGMSVDANVLIFERIREELDRGSALRMAIRNGYGRATTTIVDANLTTLITAVILYAIGTEQIRGFAFTLFLGILMSMYTAIFCSRVIFDIAERQRWVTKLHMLRLMGTTHFDFIGCRTIAAVASIVLIVIGLWAVFERGKGILAIDLSGGTSVRLVLREPMEPAEARDRVGKTLEQWDDGTPLRINGALVSYTVTPISMSAVDMEELSISPDGLGSKTAFYKVDTSIPAPETDTGATPDEQAPDYPALSEVIVKAFKADDDQGTLLAMHSLEFAEPEVVAATTDESQATGSVEVDETIVEVETDDGESPTTDDNAFTPPADGREQTEPAESGQQAASEENSQTDAQPSDASSDKQSEPGQSETSEADEPAEPESDDQAGSPWSRPAWSAGTLAVADEVPHLIAMALQSETDESDGDDQSDAEEDVADQADQSSGDGGDSAGSGDSGGTDNGRGLIQTTLTFGYEIEADALAEEIALAAQSLGINYISEDEIELTPIGEASQTARGFKQWQVQFRATPEAAQSLLQNLKDQYDEAPYFPSQSEVGSQIAGNTQVRAIGAILLSLLGIVGYIWVRFQRVMFGLAAVVALVHDVLFVLGAIAISYWFAGVFGFLLIEEFKISLPVVAAFLTIIGYSLNDTIVVFDRIREVRGKSPELTGDMINRSIGQTLSRTVLTSLTTMIVLLILYAYGGDAIHGFAFALVVGVVIGTYSSIFVASPVLLWMANSPKATASKAKVA